MKASASEMVSTLSTLLPGRVSTAERHQLEYARDLWPRGLIEIAFGALPKQRPEAVVWPLTTEEVVEVVRIARRHRRPVVPFGAGSGVCGGAVPIHGGLVVDLKRMSRVLQIDEEVGSASFEAGILGERLENELSRNKLTLGHFPSSIMCSTLGGWLATRSAGQYSTKYGKIEDLVEAVTFVDGRGEIHQVGRLTRPDVLQLIVGSEGTLGIITQATLRVERQPELEWLRAWRFSSVEVGLEAIRGLLQANLRPAVVRLYDELDSFLHKNDARASESANETSRVGRESFSSEYWLNLLRPTGRARGRLPDLRRLGIAAALLRPSVTHFVTSTLLSHFQPGCLLIIGFEGEDSLTRAESDDASSILRLAGGIDLGEEPAARWKAHRYDTSFHMPKIFEAGAFVDTMEVATTWDKLPKLYRTVRRALSRLAFVMAHFSHAYPDGCSIYFTFAARAATQREAEQRYDELWSAAMEATNEAGAALSHHHGVGLLKAPFMEKEHGRSGMEILRALKATFDPDYILNPGKLGLCAPLSLMRYRSLALLTHG
jgi:alkyldihydroxyacetonephosphate synthase